MLTKLFLEEMDYTAEMFIIVWA